MVGARLALRAAHNEWFSCPTSGRLGSWSIPFPPRHPAQMMMMPARQLGEAPGHAPSTSEQRTGRPGSQGILTRFKGSQFSSIRGSSVGVTKGLLVVTQHDPALHLAHLHSRAWLERLLPPSRPLSVSRLSVRSRGTPPRRPLETRHGVTRGGSISDRGNTTHMHTRARTRARANTRTHRRARNQPHAHTHHTHSHEHAHTHEHVHAHAHTHTPSFGEAQRGCFV